MFKDYGEDRGCTRTGLYGENCELPCPDNCLGRTCNIWNGTCMGCQSGWTGDFCKKRCPFGSYGLKYQYTCAGRCRNNEPCNHVTGVCNGCAAGWSGTHCEKECDVGKYGPDCVHNCSGNCQNNTPCGRENGRCFTGCISGYMDDACDKSCQNPAVYGNSCNIPCPKNCQDKICNIVNGTCFGCLPGWIGALCENKCGQGWYGQDCKNQCIGQCRGNTICNHVAGNCDSGCAAGWMTSKCNEQCLAGTYGSDCIYNCSGHCQNDVICNRETGHCDTGCKPGYTGQFCNKSCSPGRFGDRCEERCSGHCLNDEVCHHVDEICTDGCKDGYIGKRCNKTCDLGYHGINCSDVCSESCTNICRYTDGLCDCYPWHRGPNCNTSWKSDKEPEYNVPVSWIVGFTVSVTLNVFFILNGFMNLRKRLIQKESNAGRSDATYYTSTDSIQTESGDILSDHPKYQELNFTRDENLYQEIQSKQDIT